jgi:hypothetical protein
MDALERWNNGHSPLSPERRLMNEALARITAHEVMAARRAVRLLFAIDLTFSRNPALRQARIATAAMFDAVKSIGGANGLAVKLVYFRGRDCKASGWERDPAALKRAMEKLSCKAGYTQIAKVLRLALAEIDPLSGVVYIGDACEEKPEELYGLAAALGDNKTPLFMFHDHGGRDPYDVAEAKPVFETMAEASHGAYCAFGAGSAAAMRELLSTVAAFSAAGIEGVIRCPEVTTAEARELQSQLLLLGPAGQGDM